MPKAGRDAWVREGLGPGLALMMSWDLAQHEPGSRRP